MPKYKATDPKTKESFEFEWNGPGEPTESDAMRLRPGASATRRFVGSMQDNPVTAMVAEGLTRARAEDCRLDMNYPVVLEVFAGEAGLVTCAERHAQMIRRVGDEEC